MNLANIFRRRAARKETSDSEAVMDTMRPWWVWGPIGFIWYGSHHNDAPADHGNIAPHVDPGTHHNPQDFGGGFGGFDGGGGGAI